MRSVVTGSWRRWRTDRSAPPSSTPRSPGTPAPVCWQTGWAPWSAPGRRPGEQGARPPPRGAGAGGGHPDRRPCGGGRAGVPPACPQDCAAPPADPPDHRTADRRARPAPAHPAQPRHRGAAGAAGRRLGGPPGLAGSARRAAGGRPGLPRHRSLHPLNRPGETMPAHLELLPAVDIKGGQAVQLVQGVDGSEKRFGDPVEAALRWQELGAEWIHLVDLDAAFGQGSNRELQARIVGRLDIKVEMSGGIRDDESLEAAMATGCRRVNIGTAALEQPEWCARAIATYGDRVAIGLDVRGTTLAARGWTQEGGDLYETLARLDDEGCARYVVTDVNKDGMLQGPNLQLLRDVCAATDRPVVASGGVTTLDDIRALTELVPLGVEGAIAGTALYTGSLSLSEALQVTRGETS